MARRAPSGFRIMVMGNRGYASRLLEGLIANGEHVVGVCCRRTHATWFGGMEKIGYEWMKKLGIGRENDFEYQDPFSNVADPEQIARSHHIPICDAREMKNAAFEEHLRQLRPDIIFVAGFHRLIPRNIIALPRRAIINFHPSLLPRHRGGTPNRWVIRNGERESGVTAHFVNERFDEGDIILRKRISVGDNETWGALEQRIAELIPIAARAILDMLQWGTVRRERQRENDATFEPPYRGKCQLIDWSLSAQEVRRICNAIRPKSGGMTIIGGKKLCVWESEFVDGKFSALPGTIVSLNNGFLVVACGEGALRILTFLYRGKIKGAPRIVQQYRIVVGMRFGT